MKSKNLLVPKYLCNSFLYYMLDMNVIPDEEFDKCCKDLLKCWDEITHRHKYLINKESLESGSGFDIKEYPLMVQGAAYELLDRFHKGMVK